MTQSATHAIRKEDANGISVYHLIDSAGCMTRCGHYSAWGSSTRGSTTGVKFYDLSTVDANGKLCGKCVREAPVERKQTWDSETPTHKRRGVCVSDYAALLTWLENERKTFVRAPPET